MEKYVRLSVCHTRESRLNASRYRYFSHYKIEGVSSLLRPNFAILNAGVHSNQCVKERQPLSTVAYLGTRRPLDKYPNRALPPFSLPSLSLPLLLVPSHPLFPLPSLPTSSCLSLSPLPTIPNLSFSFPPSFPPKLGPGGLEERYSPQRVRAEQFTAQYLQIC